MRSFSSRILLELVVLGLAAAPAAAQTPAHGMWVYNIVANGSGLLDQDPDANQLLSFSVGNSISEVYLSIGPRGRRPRRRSAPSFH